MKRIGSEFFERLRSSTVTVTSREIERRRRRRCLIERALIRECLQKKKRDWKNRNKKLRVRLLFFSAWEVKVFKHVTRESPVINKCKNFLFAICGRKTTTTFWKFPWRWNLVNVYWQQEIINQFTQNIDWNTAMFAVIIFVAVYLLIYS